MTRFLVAGISALALMVSASAALASNPVYSESISSFSAQTLAFTFVISQAGTYDETFSWGSLSKAGGLVNPTTLNLTFQLNGSGGATNLSADAISFNPKTAKGGSKDEGLLSLSAGSYTVEISAGQSLTATNVKYTLAGVSTVPGPITGAGIPALMGLIGFGAWARRRRVV